MPIAKVQLPDGRIARFEVAEGTTPQEVEAFISQQFSKPNAASQIAQDNITRGAKDFAGDMSFGQQWLAGAGKRFSDIGLGAKQILGMSNEGNNLSSLVLGKRANEADEKRALDKPLMETSGAGAGALAADLSTAIPMMGIPTLGTVRGAAIAGSVMGALNPTGVNDSRLVNATVGGALGAGGALAGNALGTVFRPATSTLSPEAASLARRAVQEGIPLDAAAMTGSKPLQTFNSVMEQLPFTAGKEAAKKTAVQEAFTNAVLKRAGMSGRTADPAALNAQKQLLGRTFEDISTRNSLDFSKGLTSRLDDIVADAVKHLPPDSAAKVRHTIEQIKSGHPPGSPQQVVPSQIISESGAPFTTVIPAVPPGPMPGSVYQGWRTPLSEMARQGDETARYYGQIKKALDSEFGSQVSGADRLAWERASRQYGNLKTILEASGSAGNQAAQNQIPATALAGAVRSAVGKEGNALGRGDLNELARIGTMFVRDQVPNSGTAQRALMQSLITGGIGGASGYAGSGGDLSTGLIGVGAGLASPVALQSVVNSPAFQQYLVRTASSPVARSLAELAARTGGTGGVTGGGMLLSDIYRQVTANAQ